MIYKIYSNDKRFKAVSFSIGLNLILADKKQESGKKDSRNGLGKTTLIKVIDFCLGAKLDKKLLPIEKIKDWIFFIELDLCGEKMTASRAINTPNIVKIEGSYHHLPIKPETNKEEKYSYYKLDEWKYLLGICLFGIENNEKNKYAPSFRSLISYFTRHNADAYLDPFLYFKTQRAWSVQVNNAFFVGLNWKLAIEAEEIKNKNALIISLKKAVKSGFFHSQGELEASRVRLEKIIFKEKEDLSTFQVFPKYQEFQEKANSLTGDIHTLLNECLILRRKLERYEESVRSEHPPEMITVQKLYEEAGLHFGNSLKKTLEDAKKFHCLVVENRKEFLAVEIAEIKNQIGFAEKQIENHTQERSALMQILQSHGALEEFTELQGNLTKKEHELESVRSKILEIKKMAEDLKEIKASKIELETKLQLNYEISRPNWEKAVAGFNENSLALYNEPGNLIINVSENGYKFDIEIPRSQSEGIGKMKIFCYDLMLVDFFSTKNKIDFLIHDSTIFDGVDSRQIAHALEQAHKKGLENKFQYICAFNSDMLPDENFNEEFKIGNFVRLTLSDQDPKDSLIGFRYNE